MAARQHEEESVEVSIPASLTLCRREGRPPPGKPPPPRRVPPRKKEMSSLRQPHWRLCCTSAPVAPGRSGCDSLILPEQRSCRKHCRTNHHRLCPGTWHPLQSISSQDVQHFLKKPQLSRSHRNFLQCLTYSLICLHSCLSPHGVDKLCRPFFPCQVCRSFGLATCVSLVLSAIFASSSHSRAFASLLCSWQLPDC